MQFNNKKKQKKYMLVDYKVNKQTNEKIQKLQKSIVNFFLNLQNKTKKKS